MDGLIPHLSAWRVMRLGSREVIDAIVDPEAPAETVDAMLAQWAGAYYWVGDDRHRLVLVRPHGAVRPEGWWRYSLLFGVTILCTLGAGAALAGAWAPSAGPGVFGALRASGEFFVRVVQGDWITLLTGWSFALPLMAILLIHELGHYAAARRYDIDSSLPFFLPIPPTLSPIGSLGAFIRLRSPVLDRRQLLDVGASGPLAGFVVALAVLVWGYLTSERIPIVASGAPSYVLFAGQPIFLGESLLTTWMRDLFIPGHSAIHLSLPAFAGWVGAFITGLNLLPLSQLDGGHVLYGLLGRRQGVVAFLTIIALVGLAQLAPMWYFWVVLSLVVGGGRWTHPSVVIPDRHLPPSRRWIGWLCIIVFAVTFVPVPFLS